MHTPPPDPIRVLIADDDATARRALRDAVAAAPGIALCGEAATAADAIALVTSAHPDVVVVDADLPGAEGLTAIATTGPAGEPDTAVVVLALHDDEDVALMALRGGAAGYVPRSAPVEAIIRAVRGVGEGEAAVSRRMTRRVIRELRAETVRAPGFRPVESRLTPREWQVLDLIAAGASTREIAARLGVAVETVRSHVKHVLRKLGAHTRAEAVERAARWSALEMARMRHDAH